MENNPINSDLIRGHIDTIVLQSISKGDKHAQQISDFIEEKSENQYKINQATLYSSLKRLENLKFISSFWHDSESGRRKFFKISEKGLDYLNSNVNSWSESKVILDKLMDIKNNETIVEKVVEKVVFVPHNNTENSQIKPSNYDVDIVDNTDTHVSTIKEPEVTENVSTNNSSPVKNDDSTEVNFRHILNSLIKDSESTIVTKDVVTENDPKPLSVIIHDEGTSKHKFIETISVTDYNAKKTSNDGKIDFGDLAIMAKKDGFKLRISSKDSAKAYGTTNVSKLKFCTSLIMFVVCIAQFFIFNAFAPLAFNKTNTVIILSVCSVFPPIYLINYCFNKKNSKKIIQADSILTSFIIVFNLILITFALVFILDIDLSVSFNLINYLLIPIFAFIDVVIYYFIRFSLSKTKKFTKV